MSRCTSTIVWHMQTGCCRMAQCVCVCARRSSRCRENQKRRARQPRVIDIEVVLQIRGPTPPASKQIINRVSVTYACFDYFSSYPSNSGQNALKIMVK